MSLIKFHILQEFLRKGEWYNENLELSNFLYNFIEKKIKHESFYKKIKILYISNIYNFQNLERFKHDTFLLIIDKPIYPFTIIRIYNLLNNYDHPIVKINNINEFEKIFGLNFGSESNKSKIIITSINIICEYYSFKPKKIKNNINNLPYKIVDVIDKKILTISSSLAYCCWSYCWSIYNEKTEKEIFDIMCNYTLQLGFRYMWVDRYCIDQNNIKEKSKEITKIGEYYKNAISTIIWLHDINDINCNITKPEWIERLWTLQEWELSKNKWLLLKTGEYIKYNSLIHKLIPEKRVNNFNNKKISELSKLLIISNDLECSNKEDKILGIIGLLTYSDYINLENIDISSINAILNNIYNISTCIDNNENLFILCKTGNDNVEFIDNMKKLKLLINNIFLDCDDEMFKIYKINNKGVINYKGLKMHMNEIILEENFKEIDINNFLCSNIFKREINYLIKDMLDKKYIYAYINEIKLGINRKTTLSCFLYKPINIFLGKTFYIFKIKNSFHLILIKSFVLDFFDIIGFGLVNIDGFELNAESHISGYIKLDNIII